MYPLKVIKLTETTVVSTYCIHTILFLFSNVKNLQADPFFLPNVVYHNKSYVYTFIAITLNQFYNFFKLYK